MKLALYKKDTCPYCQKVLSAILAQERTDVELHDIVTSEEDLNYLIQVGGKRQVPCLFIDGKPLYESSDIVAWLSTHPQAI